MAKWQSSIRKGIDRVTRSPVDEPRCSFCGKRRRDVQKVIAGPGVFICDQCVQLCSEVLLEDRTTLFVGAADENLLLDQLRLAGQQMRFAERHVHRAVTELRQRGLTWAQIGGALGISRQSAWERFSGEH